MQEVTVQYILRLELDQELIKFKFRPETDFLVQAPPTRQIKQYRLGKPFKYTPLTQITNKFLFVLVLKQGELTQLSKSL
jgi:hypothetical protein